MNCFATITPAEFLAWLVAGVILGCVILRTFIPR